jgi:hypothetical protein
MKMTERQTLSGESNGAERELAFWKRQPNLDQNAIEISEREVARLKELLSHFPNEGDSSVHHS